MNAELKKSLIELIDESLAELEELKKSERFRAAEISLGDPKSGIKDQDRNGSISKRDDEDEDEKKKKKKEMDEEESSKDEAAKKEDDSESDDEMEKTDSGMPKGTAAEGDSMSSQDGVNRDAAPKDDKRLSKSADEKEQTESLEAFINELQKSQEAILESVKAYVDERLGEFESLFKSVSESLEALADEPVDPKGVSYKDIKPLRKSAEETEEMETLSKSEVLSKLMQLKKSGEDVATADITSVEIGGPADVSAVIQKYNLKK